MAKKSAQSGPNFVNGTIWTGDNLHIMRGLNTEAVDLVYLDPPFNSNRNYEAPVGSEAAGAAFKDAWTLSDVDRYEHGELADRHPAAYSVIESARLSYSKGMQSYLIFMAVRLLEIRRVLKDTGSVVLHCDTTACHRLRALMDAIFGPDGFRNQITWRRTNTHNDAKKALPKVSDILLFYAMPKAKFNPIYAPYSNEYVRKMYRHDDGDGRGPYMLGDMSKPSPPYPNGMYEWKGYDYPANGWRYKAETMQRLHDEKRIHYPTKADGTPDYNKRMTRKRFLSEGKGTLVGDIWDDIKALSAKSKEATGYPTQKPVALLERVIAMTTKEGDVVLDPFCGCATTLAAAAKTKRQYIGIDLSKMSVRLVKDRIAEYNGVVTGLDSPPRRTDIAALPNYRTHAHRLYGEQEGECANCKVHFPFKVMEVDHILPRAKGGTDHEENLQLLCSYCNKSKGKKTMAEWRASA